MGEIFNGHGMGGEGGGSSGSTQRCCDVNSKCWCRWKSEHHQRNTLVSLIFSSGLVFFMGCLVLYCSIGLLYFWLFFGKRSYLDAVSYNGVGGHFGPLGCQEDNEGSWSIGVFYGNSPFSLKPIEAMDTWRSEVAAWPVANPILTCASVSRATHSSNFVADPFIYIQGDVLFLFYETKNSITMHGDIGVSKSTDNGATWQTLGIALDEAWHLSYPYVFSHHGQIYMMPESNQKQELRLYRAVDFPLKWRLEKVLIKKPLVDSSMINLNGTYWIFTSDHSRCGSKKNGQLEIWYSNSPLGPWKPHKKNPIYNGDKSLGARNGGRPFILDGSLYRVGQDSDQTYGRRLRVFKVGILTKEDYREEGVPFTFGRSSKGRNSWNGARHHHLDAQQVRPGEWIAVMDGDRVPSGDPSHRFFIGCVSFAAVSAIAAVLGVLVGAIKCTIPLNWCSYSSLKRNDSLFIWDVFSPKLFRFRSRLSRTVSTFRGKIKPNRWIGRSVLTLLFLTGAGLMCSSVVSFYGGNGSHPPYPLNGYYSQFTLLTMTYDARIWNLKMYVKHYSRCASVREIVVVWNKGTPPDITDFDSAVPVRIRNEKKNSLNNRFRKDPLISTRAVLELDDDIMMNCDDIERGFNVWRRHPDRLVGFYPRLIHGKHLTYRAERYARAHNGYNMILTGAAFMDANVAFDLYWNENALPGRKWVDKRFNCEDVLMNYLYANASSSRTVEYVRPTWAIDTSKFSGAAISKDTQSHYRQRSYCLRRFSEMYGSISDRKWEFGSRKDGWDL